MLEIATKYALNSSMKPRLHIPDDTFLLINFCQKKKIFFFLLRPIVLTISSPMF